MILLLLNKISPHFQLISLYNVDQSLLRIHWVPPSQYSTIISMTLLPQNALRRDFNGKCIELIEGHYLEVVVEV